MGSSDFSPQETEAESPWSTQQSAWATQQVPSQPQPYGKALTKKKVKEIDFVVQVIT